MFVYDYNVLLGVFICLSMVPMYQWVYVFVCVYNVLVVVFV